MPVVTRAYHRIILNLICSLPNDVNVILQAFKVYVRPLSGYASGHLTYSSISASLKPWKRSSFMSHLTCVERLELLGLESLEARGIRLDLTLLEYKILCGKLAVDWRLFFTVSSKSVTGGHAYKLFHPSYRTSARQHFFCNRIVKPRNNWQLNGQNTLTLNCFKNYIIAFNFRTIYLWYIIGSCS